MDPSLEIVKLQIKRWLEEKIKPLKESIVRKRTCHEEEQENTHTRLRMSPLLSEPLQLPSPPPPPPPPILVTSNEVISSPPSVGMKSGKVGRPSKSRHSSSKETVYGKKSSSTNSEKDLRNRIHNNNLRIKYYKSLLGEDNLPPYKNPPVRGKSSTATDPKKRACEDRRIAYKYLCHCSEWSTFYSFLLRTEVEKRNIPITRDPVSQPCM
jgi:hypothetical protein